MRPAGGRCRVSDALVQISRRKARGAPGDHTIIDDLREGRPDAEIAAAHGVPAATVRGVRTFYDFLGRDHGDACTGTACAFAGGAAPLQASGDRGPHCLGRCYAAPARLDDDHHPIPFRSLARPPMVFRHLLSARPALDVLYATPDADSILDVLDQVDLRGRGGAAFATGAKWRAARAARGSPKYVVANGDEGDPGSFVDRLLLEEDPHAVLAGMQACAVATGATNAIVFVRAEYPRAARVVRAAIAEADAAGVLRPGLRFSVRVGAGSYVCGEETALLRAIEGLRAEPRPKPPFPSEHGLFGKPTVVQNVETLALVPEILRTRRRSSTKAFSVSGCVNEPGAVEAELGITLRRLIDEGAGGVRAGRAARLAVVGGPMGRVVPASEFDVRLGYDTLPGLGHGGVVVLDDSVSVEALARHLFTFAARESCGACTPCRVGTAQLRARADRASLERLLDTLEMGSMCGFGQGVPRPIRDLLAHFGDALFGATPASGSGGAT